MYAGRIVEQGTLDEIFYDPQHPYTWGLLGSITRVDQPRPERLPAIAGLPPSLADRPEGCHFRPALPARVRASAPRCRRSRRASTASPGTATAAGSAPRRSASCARCARARSGWRRRRARRRERRGAAPTADERRRRSSRSSTSRSSSRSSRASCRPRGRARARGQRRDALDRRGRDARPGGRVGLRQDHDVARDHAPDRRHRGHDPLPRRRHHAGRAASRWSRCGARCRWSSRTRSPRSTRASASVQIIGLPLRLHGTVARRGRGPGARAARGWWASHPST